MFQALVLSTLLFLAQKPEVGVIAGNVVGPDQLKITQPVQVVLFSQPYANLWSQKLQEQLDLYWERYKPAFAQKKELFFEVSRMAYRDAMQFVMARMSRDLGSNLKTYRIDSTADGKFEFRNVPVGDYKIVAYGRAGEQVYYWQESVELTASFPQFVQLKKHVP